MINNFETELYRRWYLVTAESSDEAMEKIKHGD